MIIIPLNERYFLGSIIVAFLFEGIRIAIAFFLASDSQELRKMYAERKEAQIEIGLIKSIQLEFVRHSLLSRKIIKYDKQIEDVLEKQVPFKSRVQTVFRVLRVALYVGGGIYLHEQSVIMVEPFVSAATINLL